MLRRTTGSVKAAPGARMRRHGATAAWHHDTVAVDQELIDAIAGLNLFADLSQPQLEGISHILDERTFPVGERVLRQGLSGSAFYVIVEGEVRVVVDGTERATLARGEFFGEVSVLLGEMATADVFATRPLRCLVLPGAQLEPFLIAHPRVMYRMLQAQARRLRAANRWGS
jgi:CRP-like cAMP-binding protein